jgi:uncharacterized protein
MKYKMTVCVAVEIGASPETVWDFVPCANQRSHTKSMNDWAINEARAAPERLFAFCGLPWMSPWAPQEIARCGSEGAKGVKLHQVNSSVSLKDRMVVHALDALFEAAGEAGLPILIHVKMDDASEVRSFFEVAGQHPDTRVIVAHQLAQSLALLSDAPENVWIEISGITHAPVEAGQFFVPVWRNFGIERILFGSDFPGQNPSDHMKMLAAYPLTKEERRAILIDNPKRLWGFAHPETTSGDLRRDK